MAIATATAMAIAMPMPKRITRSAPPAPRFAGQAKATPSRRGRLLLQFAITVTYLFRTRMNAGKGARDLPASAARRARCAPTFSYAVGVHRRSSASYKIRHHIYRIVYLALEEGNPGAQFRPPGINQVALILRNLRRILPCAARPGVRLYHFLRGRDTLTPARWKTASACTARRVCKEPVKLTLPSHSYLALSRNPSHSNLIGMHQGTGSWCLS
jgi:hypothetical protein